MVLVTVCSHHVRETMRYLKALTPMPDLIEAWRLETFVEQQGMVVREFGDLHVLREVA